MEERHVTLKNAVPSISSGPKPESCGNFRVNNSPILDVLDVRDPLSPALSVGNGSTPDLRLRGLW
jgi:hypothetical protein